MENTKIHNSVDFIYLSGGKGKSSDDYTKSKQLEQSYKLFYICKGSCRAELDGAGYELSENDSFMVFPYQGFTISQARGVEYLWIEFSGINASAIIGKTSFSMAKPVIHKLKIPDCEKLFNLYSDDMHTPYAPYRAGGKLLILISYYIELAPNRSPRSNNYVSEALIYIERNFHRQGFGTSDVANYLKIDRTHLYRLFMNETGISVSKCITRIRVAKAESLLANENNSVGSVAAAVGFGDQLYFSRVFRQTTGKSPSEFRSGLKNPLRLSAASTELFRIYQNQGLL